MDSLLESAFGVWARASRLTFVRANSRSADIVVEFVTSGGSLFGCGGCGSNKIFFFLMELDVQRVAVIRAAAAAVA